MHSPFPFSWTASAPSLSTAYQPLDDYSTAEAAAHEYATSNTYVNGSRTGLLSPVHEDVWSTFHFPSSPTPDESEYQPGALSPSAPFTLRTLAIDSVAAVSSSSPQLTPAIRHLRLQSDVSIFPSLNAHSSSAVSATSTPQRSSPGSPTVAAFLANPELLPKLLGRGKHQPQPVSSWPASYTTTC